MKTRLLTLALVSTFAIPQLLHAEDQKPKRPGAAGAGAGAARMNPEERLKKMTEQLSLTQEQQDKIKAIFETGREELGKLRDVPEDQRREKMREAFKAQNEKVVAILTPEQQTKYKAAIAERMQHAKGGGRAGAADAKPEEKK